MEIRLVYMTAGSREEAGTIGRELVEGRLAACVNIIDHMRSLYWWEGEVQEDTEVVLIAKTTETKLPALVEKVKSMHSYDCPCIVSLPISGGNGAFLEWIAAEAGG
jgi:periplasmic divalent cation tolerance protein